MRALYETRHSQHKFVFAYDLRDSSQRNFLVHGKQVMFVDEGGIGKLAGLGMARMARRAARRSTAARLILGRKLEAFRNGYERSGPAMPAAGYVQMVSLFDLGQHLYRSYHAGTSTVQGRADLDRLINRETSVFGIP